MVKNLFFLIIVLTFVSCSSLGRKEKHGIRNAYQSGDYDAALAKLEESKTYKEEKNKLLYHLEKGKILFNKDQNYLSALEFQKAKNILEKLYTKSVSKKTLSFLVNDKSDVYYGENYEKSLIHFFQALNFYKIYIKGFYSAHENGNIKVAQKNLTPPQRRQELLKARAEIVSWNTLIENLKLIEEGKSVFKNDLMAKVLGAIIHEEIDKSTDRQIALQLYKDAYNLLLKNYSVYKSFNKNFENLKKEFSEAKKLSKDKFIQSYINPTPNLESLKAYLQKNIYRLTKKIRPYKLKVTKKRFDIKEDFKLENKPNVTIIIEREMIADKKAKKEYLSLGHVLNDPKASGGAKFLAGVGSIALTAFAANKLGLMPPPRSYNPVGAHLGYNVARSLAEGAAISFELPQIISAGEPENMSYSFRAQDKSVASGNVYLVNPVSDIAEESLVEKSASRYTRLGTRLVLKHLSAIAASYATYKALRGRQNDNDFMARSAAVIQYLGVAKGIEASESADTRQWSTLPSGLWIIDQYLPNGEYSLMINTDSGEKNLGTVKVEDSKRKILTFRI